MSDKKNISEDAMEDPSSIEIVTVGVKNSNAEIIHKDPKEKENNSSSNNVKDKEKQNPAPASPVQVEQQDDPVEVPPSHTKLGDKEDEEKIRQHVHEMMNEVEAEESHQSQSSEESNVSQSQQSDDKSSKSNRKDGPKSNYQSNDERKEDLPTSRKCFNKQCSSKKIYKKIRSRVQDNKYRFFCKNCYENYYNNLYCEFCQQIYSINCENEDDDKWIGCDKCERWNHIQCEKKFRDKNVNELKDKNLLYECLACTQRAKNTNQKTKKNDKEPQEEKITAKQKIEINKDQRTPIFHKKIQTFPNLEYFLQNYSFRLWMNESQIREDIEHLRNTCLKANADEAGKNKFKKTKID